MLKFKILSNQCLFLGERILLTVVSMCAIGDKGSMMTTEKISRRHLNNKEFLKLRQATEKITQFLTKRLKTHLDVIKPLFNPRLLLGNYIKSAIMDEVAGTDKAFAELQELYGTTCEKPFGLPRKLTPPLPPIFNQLDTVPSQYSLSLVGSEDKTIEITSPTRWILSYRSECPLNRLRAMASGMEARQTDEMRQGLINHLAMVIFLKHFPALNQLLEDLRYQVNIRNLVDLGNLPVVVLTSPVETFLPPDDFIAQITQLSGIPAFQEIIDPEGIENVPDPLKEALRNLIR
jgi:hypothetical protein